MPATDARAKLALISLRGSYAEVPVSCLSQIQPIRSPKYQERPNGLHQGLELTDLSVSALMRINNVEVAIGSASDGSSDAP